MTKPPTRPTLTIDVKKYEHYLAESNATQEEKEEFLNTIWNLVCEFVQMGYNVHPVQQALQDKNCGQVDNMPCTTTPTDSPVVESRNDIFTQTTKG